MGADRFYEDQRRRPDPEPAWLLMSRVLSGEHHYFVISATERRAYGDWTALIQGLEDVFEAGQARSYQVWVVPGSSEGEYGIENCAPQVDGAAPVARRDF